MNPAWVRGLSLLTTPLLFLVSAHELYLRNQKELGGNVVVLLPFWAAAAAVVACGFLLLHHRARVPALMWAYYLAGPFFLLFRFAGNVSAGAYFLKWLLDTRGGVMAMLAAFVWATAWAARRWPPDRAAPPLAAFALVLLIGEAASGVRRFERLPTRPDDTPSRPLPATAEALPNVYHVILDGFQGDLFAPASSPEIEQALEGFVYYPQTRGLEKATVRSLRTLLISQAIAPDDTRLPDQALGTAFASEPSLISQVRRAGYVTVAYIPANLYPEELTFDQVRFHAENLRPADAAFLQAALFWRVWLLATLPAAVAEPLEAHTTVRVQGTNLSMIRNLRASGFIQPLVARLSFRKLLQDEPALPARGRYTWIHVLLPHTPYLLQSDCTARNPADPSDALEQTRCTLHLLHDLLAELKQLDRYHESLIVVHGDHGLALRLEGGRLIDDPDGWFRPLLLVKRPERRAPLRIAPEPASLLDVAPTMLEALGIARPPTYQGRVLAERH